MVFFGYGGRYFKYSEAQSATINAIIEPPDNGQFMKIVWKKHSAVIKC